LSLSRKKGKKNVHITLKMIIKTSNYILQKEIRGGKSI
jgi:hypothetical protein